MISIFGHMVGIGTNIYCITATTHLAPNIWIERAGEKLLFLLFLLQ